jgi:hypothetical protein
MIESLHTLPLDQQHELMRSMERETYRESLFLTAHDLLQYQQINMQTHGRMIKTLEQSGNKLIVMPRGTFKTSIAAVAYTIWLLIRDPNLRVLLDSELYSNSKNTLREVKAHIESDRFKSYFGEWRGDVWNEGEILIKARTAVKKEATITCSGIGAQKTGQHYDVIVADDMNSPKNSHTPELRQKVIDHYRYYTSLLDPGGMKVIIGTRYSSGDLIGFICDQELGLTEDQIRAYAS